MAKVRPFIYDMLLIDSYFLIHIIRSGFDYVENILLLILTKSALDFKVPNVAGYLYRIIWV